MRAAARERGGARARVAGLRGYQRRTVRALRRAIARHPGETFTVMYPRQAGKNPVAAVLVAWLLWGHAGRGGSVVVCAPSYRPQALISVERVLRLLRERSPLHGRGQPRIDYNTITLGRASATFLSASPEAHVAGHTASLALIADEAQEIDAAWFDRHFRPMAAATGAPTVLFGTPWDGRTFLETAVAANRARDSAMAARGDDFLPFHHEVSWREVAVSLPVYGAYVRAQRARLGANHPLYLSQYELVAT